MLTSFQVLEMLANETKARVESGVYSREMAARIKAFCLNPDHKANVVESYRECDMSICQIISTVKLIVE